MVSIVVLAHNNREVSRRCVASVLAHTRPDYELILVDNGSTDGTAAYFQSLARRDFRVHAVVRERNYGVCARNFGFEQARGEFICTLDNDTEVGEGWLEALLAPLADPGVGGTGVEGVCFDNAWAHAVQSWQLPPDRREGLRVDVLVGYCFLFRNLVAQIGGYDWAFGPFWNEEADFCLRLKAQGLRLEVHQAAVRHHAHATSARYVENVERLMADHDRLLRERWDDRKGEVFECNRGTRGCGR